MNRPPLDEPGAGEFGVEARAAAPDLVTLADLVRWAASRFAERGLAFGHGADNPLDEALMLVLGALRLDPGLPTELWSARLSAAERSRLLRLVERRVTERVPTAYLTNRAWFAGLLLHVDERVLVPRSPLAEWVERRFEPWVDAAGVRRVLDIGTGSGCLAIACAYAFADAEVDAVDVSADALEVARRNVAEHGLEGRVRLHAGDLFPYGAAPYDLVVSNPPYVGRDELAGLPPEYHHEPRAALDGGDDGLACLERIVTGARAHLTPTGVLVVEVGTSREALERRFPRLPFTWLECARGGDDVFLLPGEDLPSAPED